MKTERKHSLNVVKSMLRTMSTTESSEANEARGRLKKTTISSRSVQFKNVLTFLNSFIVMRMLCSQECNLSRSGINYRCGLCATSVPFRNTIKISCLQNVSLSFSAL